jgi:signal transduction histidine kinase
MSKRRDLLVAVSAATIVVVLVVSAVIAVLSAERNGRKALEDLELAQLEQLARVLDGAFTPALSSTVGLNNPTTRAPWTLTVADATDRAGLDLLQNSQPTARTGYVLVDMNSTVTNGTLLQDPAAIGRHYDRPGLDEVLRGTPAVLVVGSESLTTPLPTIAIARPLRVGADGAIRGAIIQESDVAPDSQFTQLIKVFERANTDEYSFLDTNGVVVSSTNAASVGKKADAELLQPQPGFHRHGDVVTATATIPSVSWTATFRQSTDEFEGDLTGPLRSALLILIVITALGAALTFFVLLSRLRAAGREHRRLADISEAREEFISIVSHELRTPATGQLGFLQTLLDHWDELSEEDRRKTVTQAYANARRLHALSRDVLDTASIEAGELPYAFEVMDLRPAVESAIHALPTENHEINVFGEDGDLSVRADPERIQQVLTNVLDNAMKNAPVGSRIDVRVDTVDGEALVEVSDRGLGLSDDDFERSFEKFSRGRSSGVTGTGLGLYICRMIVTAHRGRIWITRREGGGATVSFTLPLAATADGSPDAAVSAAAPSDR